MFFNKSKRLIRKLIFRNVLLLERLLGADALEQRRALARMRNAIDELVVDGIKTNTPLHRELVRDPGFCKGGVNIHYLEHKMAGK